MEQTASQLEPSLHQKISLPSIECPICHQEDESVIHLIYKCTIITRALYLAVANIRIHDFPCYSTIDLILYCNAWVNLERNISSARKILIVADEIWRFRNKIRHDSIYRNISDVISTCINRAQLQENVLLSLNRQQWQPPLSQHGLDFNSIRKCTSFV